MKQFRRKYLYENVFFLNCAFLFSTFFFKLTMMTLINGISDENKMISISLVLFFNKTYLYLKGIKLVSEKY